MLLTKWISVEEENKTEGYLGKAINENSAICTVERH